MDNDQHNEASLYCLTEEEKATVHEVVSEMFPKDMNAQTEVSKFRGACVLLKKIFGADWYQANVAPQADGGATFIRRSLSDESERYLYVVRVIELAEALHSLRHVPGLSHHVEVCKQNTQRAEALESAWFEFFSPYLVHESGHEVVEFVINDGATRTPDMIVHIRGRLLSIEVKAKLEGNSYSRRSLSNSLKVASTQLPERGPGAVFLMIHSHWLHGSDFQRDAENVLNRALLRYRNVNAVFVLWPLNQKLSTGGFMSSWRFQHFVARDPYQPLDAIEQLLARRE